eukprot:CAMPEP_0174726840 /NCGR_PEP_ID=MMETSP1094-20130205/48573_1 /TAXON_ID=156173 /ORGANISM="Chrysochromulina brevifilum, Strain UTEX LB 985" /LENGTH=84 /DNA_ID=CAMNT_0015928465 /DNA_START=143 /DNA_END=394 /DNA_ORIENTATION=+
MSRASSRVRRSQRQLQQSGSPSLSKAHGRQQQSFRANLAEQQPPGCRPRAEKQEPIRCRGTGLLRALALSSFAPPPSRCQSSVY